MQRITILWFLIISSIVFFMSCGTTGPEEIRIQSIVFPDSIVSEMDSFDVEIYNPTDSATPVQIVLGPASDLNSGILSIGLSSEVETNFIVKIKGFTQDQIIIHRRVNVVEGLDHEITDLLGEVVGDSSTLLSSLVFSEGALTPGFLPGLTSYFLRVEENVTSLIVTPTSHDPSASILVNGDQAVSGHAFTIDNLQPGDNQVQIEVRTSDTTFRYYDITIHRKDYSVVKLTSLEVSSGSLIPMFNPDTSDYSLNLLYTDSLLSITPNIEGSVAIELVSSAVGPDTAITLIQNIQSQPINIGVGENNLTITISGADSLQWIYNITVNRAEKPSPKLYWLTVSPGYFTPGFYADSLYYFMELSHSDSVISLVPVAQNELSVISVNEEMVNSGDTISPIQLDIGVNLVEITVKAYDNDSTIYIL
jgi:hypothetical protein